MEYGDILRQVEEQKKKAVGQDIPLCRPGTGGGLFFTETDLDQIMIAAFDFVNELLTLDSSSLYCIRDDRYELVREKGRSTGIQTIDRSKKLNDLAVFHGGLLKDRASIHKYFDESIPDSCNIEIIVPIAIDGVLEGFLMIPGKIQVHSTRTT